MEVKQWISHLIPIKMGNKLHSWPKFIIVLIRKWEGNSTTSHFLYGNQNSWMVVVFPIQFFWTVVVFPIQIFWTVVVFTIQIFLTVVFWQVFLKYSTNFEFLSGMLLLRNINGSSCFYKGPRTSKVSKSADPSGPWTFRLY